MGNIFNNEIFAATVEGFNLLILLVIGICLIYYCRTAKNKLWQYFLLYVSASFLSQLLDFLRKMLPMSESTDLTVRLLSTLPGYGALYATVWFIVSLIELKELTRKSYRYVLYVLLTLQMIASMLLKIDSIGYGQGIAELIPFLRGLYFATFVLAMAGEFIMVCIYKRALNKLNRCVFAGIPIMHLFIFLLFRNDFNLQYILRNIGATVMTLLVMGISMNQITADLERETARSENYSTTMHKFLGGGVTKQLIESDDSEIARGKLRNITTMFADLQGFTHMCEQEAPTPVLEVLNQYMTIISDCVLETSGTLDKYIGDCGMAFWNGVADLPNGPELACECALKIRHRVAMLNADRAAEGLNTFYLNIGINCGETIIGSIGSDERAGFTVIGDNVNIAQRLESEADDGQIFLSRAIVDRIGNAYKTRFVKRMVLRGRENETDIFELL